MIHVLAEAERSSKNATELALNCPRCSFEIKGDFGMVSCPSCGEMVLLDDGDDMIISHGSKDPELPEIPRYIPNNEETIPPVRPPPPPAPIGNDNVNELDLSSDDIDYVLSSDQQEAKSEHPRQALGQWEAQDPNKPGLDEIAKFGNSEISQASDGLLMFNVFVDGIDTNELRASVRQILADKRFLWDADKLISSIRNGNLRINKVSSIKASLLVRRLKNLDVRIQWEQYAIMQSIIE
jgi:hypothetical protein